MEEPGCASASSVRPADLCFSCQGLNCPPGHTRGAVSNDGTSGICFVFVEPAALQHVAGHGTQVSLLTPGLPDAVSQNVTPDLRQRFGAGINDEEVYVCRLGLQLATR